MVADDPPPEKEQKVDPTEADPTEADPMLADPVQDGSGDDVEEA